MRNVDKLNLKDKKRKMKGLLRKLSALLQSSRKNRLSCSRSKKKRGFVSLKRSSAKRSRREIEFPRSWLVNKRN